MVSPVLIIGAAGYLGSNIARRLKASGVAVVGLASRQPSDLSFDRFHVGRSELVGVLMAAIEDCGTVVFAGGTSRPGSPMRSIGAEMDAEACHLLDVAELCAARGVKRFVFISSGGAVYGPSDAPAIAEIHPTNPINSYGLAKLTAEHGLRLVAARTGLSTISLRVANPYGPGQFVKGNQGFIAALVGAIKDRKPIEIWGDGTIVRDFVYIDDVTAAFEQAILSDLNTEIINIGSGSGASLLSVIDLFEVEAGVRMDVTHKPARSVDVPSVVLNIERARRLLGWEPAYSLREGVRATLRHEGLLSEAASCADNIEST